MSAIFISHSSLDSDLARDFERRLAQRNYHSVFLDVDPEKGIVGGQSWERTLYRKLRACRAVIALCTDRYLASRWCFAEIALARMEGKQIIALKADPLDANAELPAILMTEQLIDLRADADEAYRRLWRALAALDLPAAAGDWDPKQPPYPGLSAYQEAHAPVFFGREGESLAGLELLERGAPNLVMVLGASGSGKSSLMRAGMLPRLRQREDQWLIIDVFRPGRDPLSELAESLARTWARARTGSAHAGPEPGANGVQRLRERLLAAPGEPPTASPGPAHEMPGDLRLQRLVELLERLRADPPTQLGAGQRQHLAWTLEDLQRLLASPTPAEPALSTGEPPLVQIARELTRAAQRRDARVLIVIDQFEELLGTASATVDAPRFLALLREAIEAEHSPLRVLATMRSDYLGLFQRHSALQGIDFESLSLGPMRVDGMRRVIEIPARLAAIETEPGLVERLLEDTATPDALPLLSFTLSVLCRDRRDEGRLTLADYERVGGLQGTIAREADAVLAAAVRNRDDDALRIALLQMARLAEDGSHARVAVEWTRPEIERARASLEQLVERRVLVSRAEGEVAVVEVAHEALFRTWAPLRTWLDNARSDLLLRQQLVRDAAHWLAGGRLAEDLWRGGRLLQAGEWLKRAGTGAGKPERDFVRAGLRRRWTLRTVLGVATLFVVVVLAGLLHDSRQQADLARREQAKALDLARVSVAGEWLGKDPTVAALALLEVGDPEGTRFAPRRMSEALHRGIVAAEFRHAGPVHGIAVSADGSRVVTTSGHDATIWDARTARRLMPALRHDETVTSAAFDPAGRFVVVQAGTLGNMYTGDGRGQRAWVHDAATGQLRATIEHEQALTALEFSPDGRWLVCASQDGSVRWWDIETGRSRVLLRAAEPAEPVAAVVFGPDAKRLVLLANRSARLLTITADAPAPGPAIEFETGVQAAAFSPDATTLAVAGYNGVAVLDAATGQARYPMIDHPLAKALAFSPDGRWLLSATRQEVRVWLAETGAARFSEPIVHPLLGSAAFSADGSRVLTAPGHEDRNGYAHPAHDNTLRFWDAATGQSRGALNLAPAPEVMSISFDARRQVVAANSAVRVGGGRTTTLHQTGTARLWHLDWQDRREVQAFSHDVAAVASSFSPDEQSVLTAAGDTVRVWARSTGKPALELRHAKAVNAASFSADGRFVVSASDDGSARVWSAADGRARFVARHPERVLHATLLSNDRLATYSGGKLRLWKLVDGSAESDRPDFVLHDYSANLDDTIDTAAFSAEGSLVAARVNESIQVWDLNQPTAAAPRHTLPHRGWARTAVFVDGHRFLVTGADESAAHVWDMETGRERFALDHGAAIQQVVVSPDGQQVLTVGDGKVRLWDRETGRPLRALDHGCGVSDAYFVDAGRRIASQSSARVVPQGCEPRVLLWDAASGQLLSTMALGKADDIAFSRDGRRMLSQHPAEEAQRSFGVASTLRVWDTELGEARFAEDFLNQDYVRAAEFSADGAFLLSAAGPRASIRAVGGRELQQALAATTSTCLSPEFLKRNLGESDAMARHKAQACEQRHGRD